MIAPHGGASLMLTGRLSYVSSMCSMFPYAMILHEAPSDAIWSTHTCVTGQADPLDSGGPVKPGVKEPKDPLLEGRTEFLS